MDPAGDYLICSPAQGGCGEMFTKGSRALVLTSRQVQRILISDGDLPYSEFEAQTGLFCDDCIDNLESHGGIMARHSSRGEYLISFSWIMKRTNY